MMKYFFLCCIAGLTAYSTIAQETIKKTDKHENPSYTEVYYVLKADKSVRHGLYQYLNYKKVPIIEGYYKMGKKDSLWTEYNWGRTKLIYKGFYKNDEKTGVWEYYTFAGELEQQYDHSTQKLVYNKEDVKMKDSSVLVYQHGDSMLTKVDQLPILIGGNSAIMRSFNKNLKYPAEAIDTERSGTVWISFTINTDGSATDFRVKNKVFKALDNEALRVVQLIPHSWIPAEKNGQKVAIRYALPVIFKISFG